MPKIDNDETKRIAQPFIILANVRTGGTFLAHCLSNHMQVHCDRGETIHHGSIWRKRAAGIPFADLFHLLLHQEGYKASGFRMIYRQAFDRRVWPLIVEHKCRIIHLWRENVLRQSVSWLFQQRVRHGKEDYFPVHTFKDQQPPQVELSPESVIVWCKKLEVAALEAHNRIKHLNSLEVEYGRMVDGEGNTNSFVKGKESERITGFLGVESTLMFCDLKRVTAWPLYAMLTNWPEVREAVEQTKYAVHLADEVGWTFQNGRWVRNG